MHGDQKNPNLDHRTRLRSMDTAVFNTSKTVEGVSEVDNQMEDAQNFEYETLNDQVERMEKIVKYHDLVQERNQQKLQDDMIIRTEEINVLKLSDAEKEKRQQIYDWAYQYASMTIAPNVQWSSEIYPKMASKKEFGLQEIGDEIYQAARAGLAMIKLRIPHFAKVNDIYALILAPLEVSFLFCSICARLKDETLFLTGATHSLDRNGDRIMTDLHFAIRRLSQFTFDPYTGRFTDIGPQDLPPTVTYGRARDGAYAPSPADWHATETTVYPRPKLTLYDFNR